ncbi:MAG: nicotinate-nucleotide--dimethylbenzimidazole phosphoribosyltransferase [Victivallales bacterium]|nr:nicotinate-nucleotide--dimethylbenzimidazole phosphoribosyltransferase [Victivallales bacterium]
MKLLRETLAAIAPQSQEYRDKAAAHIDDLTMPRRALGRLLELAEDLAGMTRSLQLPVARKNIVLFAGDHGVVAQGVTLQPQEVTRQMIYNFIAGGAGINALAANARAAVTVVDIGVAGDLSDLAAAGKIVNAKIAPGTADFCCGPAMTRDQAVQALETGMAIAAELAPETDVFGTGEMGIGNTTPSSAIIAVLTGMTDSTDLSALVDRGAGLPSSQLPVKIAAIRRGIELNHPDPADGIDVLAKVGGFEIGGIAGLILGAAAQRRPVVVDGFISTAGALIAKALCPAAVDYMICAHGSMERGHRFMLEYLGKKPLLDLNMRLGEGTGAALAMNLLDAAAAVMTRMATFGSAGVTDRGL